MITQRNTLLFVLFITAYVSFFNQFSSVFRINSDKASQLQATNSFYHGKGLTVEDALHTDLSKKERKPLIGWPPGYTFFLILLHPLTGDFIISTSVLNFLFLFLYLAICYLILKALDIPFQYIVVFFLFTIFTNQPVLNLTTTDLIGLVCFLAMLFLFLKGYKDKVTHWLLFISIGFLGFFSVLVKYNFLPFVFVFPAFFILVGVLNKKKEIFYGGILSGVVLISLTFGFLLFQKTYTGHYTYLTAYDSGRKWYFENLLEHSPFAFELLYVRDPFKLIGVQFSFLKFLPHFFSVSLLVGLLYFLVKKFKRGPKSLTSDIYSLTYFIGTAFIFLNLAMLIYLSVSSPKQNGTWTYVEEFRYFAPASFLIFFFLLLSASGLLPFGKVARVLLLSSLLFSVALKAYKTKTYGFETLLDTDRFSFKPKSDSQLQILNAVKGIVEDVQQPVIYGDRSSNQRLMDLANAGVIWQFDDFIKSNSINSSRPVVVLIGTNGHPDRELKEFLVNFSFHEVFSAPETSLYRLDYSPK